MRADVRAVGVVGSRAERALDVAAGRIERAGLAAREGAHREVPPVVAAGGLEGLEEGVQRGLAARESGEAEQPEDAGARRHHHAVARMLREVHANRLERTGGITEHDAFEREHMAALALGQPLGQRERLGDRRARRRPSPMRLVRAGERGVRQREARVGLDRAAERGLDAGPCAQQPRDAVDIGVARGGGRGGQRQAAVVFETHRRFSMGAREALVA
jgi:hypothetical protein